ncbi:MFS transporter [Streptomyces brasiliensis]|uniref:MFS transporter n=1 Tax=Streptomyces brasiliensis TaxID=1954 RepID=A0A917L9E5_9ACTN|nr:MFS transporter [Streptomyces brasiliensis]GGJ51416.1 MFS transporter [Streptomyces brasiliensis]
MNTEHPASPVDEPAHTAVALDEEDTTPPDPRRWTLLVFVALAQFMVLLDTTVVNLALPAIQSDLGASATGTEWVLTGYILCFGGLMLLGGRTADRWGRRRTFLAGAAVFTAASLLCGLAGGTAVLIAARALQGCGAAFLSPAAMSLVTTSFPKGRERTTALAVWAALAGLGGTLGVVLGGVITDSLDWRWIFYVNIPFGAVAVAGVLLLGHRREHLTGGSRPDLLGAVTVTGGLAALVYAIVNIQDHGWRSVLFVVGPFAAAVALLAAFVLVELRVADPLMPMRLFATRSLVTSSVGRILTSGVQAAVLFLCSYYLQRTLGWSTLKSGFAFLPLGIVAIAVTAPATRLMHRHGPRPVYIAGAAGSVAGLVLLAGAPRDGAYPTQVLPALLILGAAMQCCTIPVNVHGVSDVPHQQQGIASGVLVAAFQVGASLGVAVVATSALTRTTRELTRGTAPAAAWLDGLHLGFWIAVAIAVLNLINAVVGLPGRRPAPGTAPAAHTARHP